MAKRDDVVRGYAEAMYSIAEAEDELEPVEEQVYAFAKMVEKRAKVREALIDPELPNENKRNLIGEVLGERANPVAVNLLGMLVEQGRARDIGRIAESLAEVAAERRQQVVGEVRSAVPLTDAQRRRLAEALSSATGRKVEVKMIVDPDLVGGVVARVGDVIFDGSIRSRLDEAKQQLTA
ncbi:MAG: ATP synthase F1 subunit delta [Actinomycetota bacterium]